MISLDEIYLLNYKECKVQIYNIFFARRIFKTREAEISEIPVGPHRSWLRAQSYPI